MKYIKIACIPALLLAALFLQSCKTTQTAAGNSVQNVQPESASPAPVKKTQTKEEAEYSRSTSALGGSKVSFDDFQRDKAAILAIIADLDKSMKNRDYSLWRSYLTPASISYWSNKFNLQVIATKLPKKGLTLRNLGDYFSHVFIPSRIDRKVNEIRYISPSEVKAVEVRDDKDIIYYEFEKIGERWLVKLPAL